MKKETRKRRPWLWLLPVLALAALALGLWVVPKSGTQPAAESDSRAEKAASAPYLAEEDSFFSEFTVREDKVFFLCYLCIVNPSDETLPVTITGDFSADYDAGLVTERELPALYLTQEAQPDPLWSSVAGFLLVESEGSERNILPQTQEAAELFLLAPGGNVFWAVFIGPHGESTQKQDRLLPPIRIETVEGLCCEAKLGGKTVTIGRESAELLWLCRNALTKHFPDALVGWGSHQEPRISLSFQVGESLNTNSPSHSYFGDYIVFYNDVCNYSAAPMLDLAMNVQLPAGTYDKLLEALENVGEATEEPEAAPRSCTVEYGGGRQTVEGETAAELYRICADAQKRAEPGGFFFLGGERPILSLNFLWSSGLRFDYEIDGDDKSFSGLDVQSYREPLQLPAGTYDKLLEALENVGEPTKEPEAAPRSCTVEYGGGRRTVEGETAAELYRICAEAQLRGEIIPPAEEEPKSLGVSLYFLNEGNPTEGTFCDIFSDDKGWFADGLVYAPPCYAFPAGTYDALLDVLGQKGELPAPAGARIAGNQVYGLFEEDGVYALQLYSREGDLVWAFGPGRHEPRVEEAEPGLWSVSLGAGPSLSLHWTVYYRPETGQLSDAIYGILARDGERVLCISGKSLLLRGIFERGDRTMLDSFSESLAPAADPFESAAFTEDGRAVIVTYLAGEDYHKVTETVPLPQEAGDP